MCQYHPIQNPLFLVTEPRTRDNIHMVSRTSVSHTTGTWLQKKSSINRGNAMKHFHDIDKRTKRKHFSLMQIIICIEHKGSQNRTLRNTKQRNQGLIAKLQKIEYYTVYSLGSWKPVNAAMREVVTAKLVTRGNGKQNQSITEIKADGIKMSLRTRAGVNISRHVTTFVAATVKPCWEESDLVLIYVEICLLLTNEDTSERAFRVVIGLSFLTRTLLLF
jgi:hypothetical protein